MKQFCLEIVECYGSMNLPMDCDPSDRLKMAVNYLLQAAKLDNQKFDIENASLNILQECGIASGSNCDDDLARFLYAISSSSTFGNVVAVLPPTSEESKTGGKDKTAPKGDNKGKAKAPASNTTIVKPSIRDAILMISTLQRECSPISYDGPQYDLLFDLIALLKKSLSSFAGKYFVKSVPDAKEPLSVVEASVTAVWSLSCDSNSANVCEKEGAKCSGLYDKLIGYILLGGLKPSTIEGAKTYATLEPFLTRVVVDRQDLESICNSMLAIKERLLYENNLITSLIADDFCLQLKKMVFLIRGQSENDSWPFSLHVQVSETEPSKGAIVLRLDDSQITAIPITATVIQQFCSFISTRRGSNLLPCEPSVSLLLWTILRR
jgi:hypothetical protein